MKTNEEIAHVYHTNHENIIYACLTIGNLSYYIKKYNNTGIQKNVFYKLKWYFIKYLIDNCIYETGDIYTNSNSNIYRMKVMSVEYNDNLESLYNITFNLAGHLFNYNIIDNLDYIKHIIPNTEYILTIKNIIDQTPKLQLTEDSIYVYYSDFIKWCGNHRWFFIQYDNSSAICLAYEFLLNVYKRANLAIFTDPFAPSYKILSRTTDVYIYALTDNNEYIYFKCSRDALPLYLKDTLFYMYNNDIMDDPFEKYYKKNAKKYTLYEVNTDTNEYTIICEDQVKNRLIAKQNLLNHYNRYNNINNIIYELK